MASKRKEFFELLKIHALTTRNDNPSIGFPNFYFLPNSSYKCIGCKDLTYYRYLIGVETKNYHYFKDGESNGSNIYNLCLNCLFEEYLMMYFSEKDDTKDIMIYFIDTGDVKIKPIKNKFTNTDTVINYLLYKIPYNVIQELLIKNKLFKNIKNKVNRKNRCTIVPLKNYDTLINKYPPLVNTIKKDLSRSDARNDTSFFNELNYNQREITETEGPEILDWDHKTNSFVPRVNRIGRITIHKAPIATKVKQVEQVIEKTKIYKIK